jgi:hypothetical protein
VVFCRQLNDLTFFLPSITPWSRKTSFVIMKRFRMPWSKTDQTVTSDEVATTSATDLPNEKVGDEKIAADRVDTTDSTAERRQTQANIESDLRRFEALHEFDPNLPGTCIVI